MKPQNKLGGKLDKIKKKVAYESSKKVSDIARVKSEQNSALEEELRAKIKDLKHKLDTATIRAKVVQQSVDATQENVRQLSMKRTTIIAEQQRTIVKYEEGLTYYKEGKHYEKGKFKDKVLDRGEVAGEALYGDK